MNSGNIVTRWVSMRQPNLVTIALVTTLLDPVLYPKEEILRA